MFRAGMHALRGGVRTRGGVLTAVAVVALVLPGVTMLGPDPTAAASTQPSVASFTVNPSSLSWAGGTVTLSVKVANAKTCTFSVAPAIKGLPAKELSTGPSIRR